MATVAVLNGEGVKTTGNIIIKETVADLQYTPIVFSTPWFTNFVWLLAKTFPCRFAHFWLEEIFEEGRA